jgi:hypothetical protein
LHSKHDSGAGAVLSRLEIGLKSAREGGTFARLHAWARSVGSLAFFPTISGDGSWRKRTEITSNNSIVTFLIKTPVTELLVRINTKEKKFQSF